MMVYLKLVAAISLLLISSQAQDMNIRRLLSSNSLTINYDVISPDVLTSNGCIYFQVWHPDKQKLLQATIESSNPSLTISQCFDQMKPDNKLFSYGTKYSFKGVDHQGILIMNVNFQTTYGQMQTEYKRQNKGYPIIRFAPMQYQGTKLDFDVTSGKTPIPYDRWWQQQHGASAKVTLAYYKPVATTHVYTPPYKPVTISPPQTGPVIVYDTPSLIDANIDQIANIEINGINHYFKTEFNTRLPGKYDPTMLELLHKLRSDGKIPNDNAFYRFQIKNAICDQESRINIGVHTRMSQIHHQWVQPYSYGIGGPIIDFIRL